MNAPRSAADISRVTVHHNGALVERTGTAAKGKVEVRGLPLLFSSGTLRVRAAHGRVTGLSETCTLTRTDPSAPDVLDDDIVDLTHKLEAIRARAYTIKEALKTLRAVGPQDRAREAPIGSPKVNGWLSFLQLRDQLTETYRDEQRALQDQLAPLQDELRLKQQAKGAPRKPPVFSRGVSFELTEGGAFTLDYFVPAATWVPTYVLDIKGHAASLNMFAMVAQASGEDWTDVDIGFSTALFSRQTRLSDLPSWRIGRAQPAPKPAYRPLPPGLETLFVAYDHAQQNAQVRDHEEPTRGAPPTPSPLAPAGGGGMVKASYGAQEIRTRAGTLRVETAIAGMAEELDSFEDERTGNLSAELFSEAESDGMLLDDADEMIPSGDMLFDAPVAAASAPPPPGMAPPQAMSRSMKSAPRHRAGPPVESLTAQLNIDQRPDVNAAYLRMLGPNDARRGQLVPVRDEAFLVSLLEDHDVEDLQSLEVAYRGLRDGIRRLQNKPLPRGTISLLKSKARTTFRPHRTAQVPSTGTFQRVFAMSLDLDCTQSLFAVPRAGLDVYRQCKLTAPGRPLPGGPLELYADGTFLVSSHLAATGGGDAMDISMGLEPAVRLLDRVVHAEEKETGLVGKKARIEHRIAMQVRSARPAPTDIVLYGRLPVPAKDAEEDLSVELVSCSHDHKRTDLGPDGQPLDGGFAIRLTVEPGQTVPVEYRYTITLPAKAELVGGNRRD